MRMPLRNKWQNTVLFFKKGLVSFPQAVEHSPTSAIKSDRRSSVQEQTCQQQCAGINLLAVYVRCPHPWKPTGSFLFFPSAFAVCLWTRWQSLLHLVFWSSTIKEKTWKRRMIFRKHSRHPVLSGKCEQWDRTVHQVFTTLKSWNSGIERCQRISTWLLKH